MDLLRSRYSGALAAHRPQEIVALAYDPAMPSTSPTALAVSDAINHYRLVRVLSRDELSHVVTGLGHSVSAEVIWQLESRQ
ncbi:hypothetical protein ACIQUM_20780 [Amycolatopsis azurea]|uniref:hypothetical protein n=1 Tax=Amycolatopsis azurea TaxID=36819 RepID=UPI0037F4640B